MEMLDNLMLGLGTAAAPATLLYCLLGVTLGMAIGVLPGIGPLTTISLLLPITFHLRPTEALVMLAGVYYGAQYGGSTASILLNLPGTASSAVTCLDGYPMSKQGRAGIALFITTLASFVGSMIGLAILVAFSSSISELGLKFGPAEYFALMLMGLLAASTLAARAPAKGIAMVFLGLLLGMVGTDVNSGVARFTFGLPELSDGINLVVLAMGFFGISEVIASVRGSHGGAPVQSVRLRSMIPTRKDLADSALPTVRGSLIGSFFGALPGTGAVIASFISYAAEKRIAKDPSRFGHGAIEGIAAPEAANNAAAQTAFVPTLSLGIPGDAVMALMLGALIIHGIPPGPALISQQPELFWGLVVSFAIGNLMLLVLNIPLIGVWVSILRIPYRFLFPTVLIFICLGVYSVNNSVFEVALVSLAGAFGYSLSLLRFPPAPMLLGFILGPLMEEYLRRSLLLSDGRLSVFVERPISASLLAVTVAMMIWSFWHARSRVTTPARGPIERPTR